MASDEAWQGTVVGKGKELLDGQNLYRQVEVELDDGSVTKVRVRRGDWKRLEVGDRVVKEAGEKPRPA